MEGMRRRLEVQIEASIADFGMLSLPSPRALPSPGCCLGKLRGAGERLKELAGTTLWSVELSDLNTAIAT